MNDAKATNASSSGVHLDKKTLKALTRRSDRPGLIYLAIWLALLAGSGLLLHLALGGWAVVPAMLLYGTILTVPAYSISHESSHGTAFRTRWLNESVLWLTSLIFLESPSMRRYAHARHHTYTWIRGKDAQMPFATPLTFKGWLLEVSDIGQYFYDAKHLARNAFGCFDAEVIEFTPESELPKLKWEARAFLTIYLGGAAAAVAFGAWWPLFYLVIPRLVGGVVMQLYTVIQHAEMEENNPDLRKSTRSFTTNWFGRFLYANMNYHVEHHLYPTVPFHALANLGEKLEGQLPPPSKGLFNTNLRVLRAVLRRSFASRAAAGQEAA